MKLRPPIVVIAVLIVLGAFLPVWRVNRLPEEVITALDAASTVDLYSLQPQATPDIGEGNFHHYHALGHIELRKEQETQAVEQFKNSAVNVRALLWSVDRVSQCVISPRHALRVISEGSTYDLLLCYDCRQLEVFRDGKEIAFIDDAKGAPQTLNGLLTAAKIPLAPSPH